MTFKTIHISADSIAAGKSYRQFNKWLETFVTSNEVEANITFLCPETLELTRERDALLEENATLRHEFKMLQSGASRLSAENKVLLEEKDAWKQLIEQFSSKHITPEKMRFLREKARAVKE